jgi:uncharacterized short protein YbdD (DUF466 family)
MRDRRSLVASFRSFQRSVCRIAGMPDYDAHVEHLKRNHPGTPVPSKQQFYEEFIRARYEDGPTRCC